MSKVILELGLPTGISDLNPVDGRKSFYKKSELRLYDGGGVLWSYGTPVAAFDYEARIIYRLWNRYSATTARHLDSLCAFIGHAKISKREWCALPVCKYDGVYHKVYPPEPYWSSSIDEIDFDTCQETLPCKKIGYDIHFFKEKTIDKWIPYIVMGGVRCPLGLEPRTSLERAKAYADSVFNC